MNELYGVLNPATRDWTDGLLSNIFREVNKPTDRNERRYILFDGDVDALWVSCSGDIMMVALIPLFSLRSTHLFANSCGCAFIIVDSYYCHFYRCTHYYCICYHCIYNSPMLYYGSQIRRLPSKTQECLGKKFDGDFGFWTILIEKRWIS